jgi:hypothetical protein
MQIQNHESGRVLGKIPPHLPRVGEEMLCLIVHFSSTDLCKFGSSTLIEKQNSAIGWKGKVTSDYSSFKLKISELVTGTVSSISLN